MDGYLLNYLNTTLTHLGSYFCHQSPLTTICLGNICCALCCRCSFFYASFLLCFLWLISKNNCYYSKIKIALSFLGIAILGADALLFQDGNLSRMVSGVLGGTGFAYILYKYNCGIYKRINKLFFIGPFLLTCLLLAAFSVLDRWINFEVLALSFLSLAGIVGIITFIFAINLFIVDGVIKLTKITTPRKYTLLGSVISSVLLIIIRVMY